MATSGQTLNDRINAARYAIAGQGIARCVCKATTEEIIGPKKKHLDYIIACTHEQNVSIPQLANLLFERTNHVSWVVVFKALVTVHHLMCYGHDRFIQHLASSNYSFELSTFLDKTTTRDFGMSNYIRRYSRYINEKALSYRLLAFDLCKVKRGNDGVLRTLPVESLLKTLPILQQQLDALLEFDCMANDLNNGVINACFMLLFRDLIGLFACHNDGIINLLLNYYSLNRKMCREAFELYKKFLVRIDKVSDFLRVAEAVGIDKDEIPDLKRAPNSLLESLEKHLKYLESNKTKTSKSSSNSNKSSELISVSVNKSNNSSSMLKIKSTAQNEDFSFTGIKDEEMRKALEEEAQVLSQYGTETKTKSSNTPEYTKLNTTVPKTIEDIFGDPNSFDNFDSPTQATKNNGIVSSSDDTSAATKNTAKSNIDSIKSSIQFATNTLEQGSTSAPSNTGNKASSDLLTLLDGPPLFSEPAQPAKTSDNFVNSNESPFGSTPFDFSMKPEATNFTKNSSQTAFKAGNPFPEACGVFAPLPLNNEQTKPNYNVASSIFDDIKDVLQPVSSNQKSENENFKAGHKSTGKAFFTGDLDSTLANLAQNLTLEGVSKSKK